MKRTSLLFAPLLPLVLARPALAMQPLTLDGAISRALSASPTLAIAQAEVGIASGNLLAAGRWSNPSLSAEGDNSEQDLDLRQPLPIWGAPGKQWQVARLGLDAADQRQALAWLALRSEVTRVYFEAFADQERSRLAREDLRLDQQIVSIAVKRYQAGDAPRLEVLAAQTQLSRGEAGEEAAAAKARASQESLDLLLANPASVTWDLATPSFDPAVAASAQASGSAAVRVREVEFKEAKAALSAAQALRWPEPALIVGVRRLGPFGGSPPGSVYAHGGLGIGLPTWDLGQGEIAAAEARRARSEARLQQAQLVARTSVARARIALASAARRLVLAKARMTQTRQLLQLARESFAAGASDALYVIEAQRQWLSARTERLDAIGAEGAALADLLPYLPSRP